MSVRSAIRSVGCACAVLGVPFNPALVRADTNVTAQFEGGTEFDSNPLRLEGVGAEDDVVPAPLIRVGGRAAFAWQGSRAHRLVGSGFAGAKVFSGGADSENVAVIDGNLDYAWRTPRDGFAVGARGRHYNAHSIATSGSEPTSRTFRISEVGPSVLMSGSGRLRLTAGVGLFDYKPDSRFDWAGQYYRGVYTRTWWRDGGAGDPSSISLSAAYALERREFEGRAFANACRGGQVLDESCFMETQLDRADLLHRASVELVRSEARRYSLRYEVDINDSNSFGQSLMRHRFEATMTTEAWGGVFVTARARLLFNRFSDGLLLDPRVNSQSFETIDDENRNLAEVLFSRDLSERVAVEVRAAVFISEFATDNLEFRRFTVYTGVVYSYD